ncbi:hypothetical protein HanLR1_Chr16g0606091 [Helianthus annuus]|nr:hypothetical protein HanHA89_Chr16g0644961 [Helianthus annuus]KAJ0639646.1 hypothetical protein HanLR1_Chr16g0606091 [Helianthus annuus]
MINQDSANISDSRAASELDPRICSEKHLTQRAPCYRYYQEVHRKVRFHPSATCCSHPCCRYLAVSAPIIDSR